MTEEKTKDFSVIVRLKVKASSLREAIWDTTYPLEDRHNFEIDSIEAMQIPNYEDLKDAECERSEDRSHAEDTSSRTDREREDLSNIDPPGEDVCVPF